MSKRKLLMDVLEYISYNARLEIVLEFGDGTWKHMFSSGDYIDRRTIEKSFPDLLQHELSNGLHAEGIRMDRIYIPIKATLE